MSTPMFADTIASGSLLAVNDEVVVDCSGAGSVIIQIDGFGDATVEFEAMADGTNWWSLPCLDIVNIEPVNFTSTVGGGIGMWQANASGLNQLRVRCTAFSGTNPVTVTLRAGAGSSREVIFPPDIPISQGDPAANKIYGWWMKLTDGNYVAAVNSNGSLNMAQSGIWSAGRTWLLNSATDSVNVGNLPAVQAVSQNGNWDIRNITGNIPLAAGAATSLLQSVGNASLASLDSKVVACNTNAVNVVSSFLPTGAATSLNQGVGNISLASIDNKTPSLGQASMASSTPVVIANNQTQIPVIVNNFPGSQAVTGTFWQAVQPISGNVNSNASQAGTWYMRLQDSFGTGLTTTSNNLDVNLKGISGLSTGAGALDSGTIRVAQANGNSISLGSSSGKTNIGQPGTKVTVANTADQVIVSYTVTAGKTLYLQGFDCNARLTTFAATATNFGNFSLETPLGTKIYTGNIFHTGAGAPQGMKFEEPLPIAAGTVVRLVCTPSSATSYTWQGNLVGYEK